MLSKNKFETSRNWTEKEEENYFIFKKPRVLDSMESSQGATNDHDQVDSAGERF